MMKFPLLFVLVFNFSCLLQAQTPTTGSTQYDTMYVDQAPLVRNKKTVVRTEQQVKFYLSGYGAFLNNYNYYLPCTGWENRMATYKSTLKPALSYSAGADLTYAPKNIVGVLGIGYSNIMEKFSFTDVSGIVYNNTNRYQYLDIALSAGYWLGRKNQLVSIVPSAGLSYSLLLAESGYIYNVENPGYATPVSSSDKLDKGQYSVSVSCKMIIMPQSRLKYLIEPYYMGNIESITDASYPYRQYYNRVGLRLGAMFSL